MAEILKFHTDPHDLIGLIARPEVAVKMGLPASDARAVYPLALAALVVKGIKDAQDPILAPYMGIGPNDPPQPPLMSVELRGYDAFRTYVRGQFHASKLEEFEIREAFDIICRYARRPGEGLRFKVTNPAQERLVAQLKLA